MKQRLHNFFSKYKSDKFSDLPPWQHKIHDQVKPFTMTGSARIFTQINAVEYIVNHALDGAIVECGVWRGGSMMAAALTLLHLGDTHRDLYLYDTFSGMTKPGDDDLDMFGSPASTIFKRHSKTTGWCEAGMEEVLTNMKSTGYSSSHLHFIKGDVEQTLPASAPAQIALLRLDTDWYTSTLHELNHLYPLVTPYGIVIVDDYGHWQGARKAVDHYIQSNSLRIFLHRIDYSARVFIKSPS